MTIPISFASDLDASIDSNQNFDTDIELNQLSENSFLINQELNDNNLLINKDLEEDSLEDNINSDSNLNKDNLYEEPMESGVEIDDSGLYDLSSNNRSSSSNLTSSITDLPNLDTSFSKIKIVCSDENTIFVNNSYTGIEMDGTKSKPFKSLSDGFNQLSRYYEKTNLFIADGYYNVSSEISIYKSINIIGENTQNTIISGLNKFNIFRIPSSNLVVNIINLTLTNGLSNKGGAVYVSQSSLNIINTVFSNNRARNNGEGGALYNNAGFIKIYNSTFLNNSVYNTTTSTSEYGGAIYNNLGELSVFNSKFIKNSLQGDWVSGGAIYNFNGFLTLFNSSILNTTLNPRYHSLGGAICIWNGRNSYIINSTISGNVINGNYGFGSAIANKGVLLEIINSTISNNYANTISVENSTVYNMNGIYNSENSTFKNNTIKNASSDLLLCLEDQLIISDLFNDNSLGNLPSSYDLREEGLVTSVKNQSPSGDCWAFAIYSALESYLLKNENIIYDFSENNMKNLMYVNGANGTDWNNGGNHIMAFAYLLRGSGPVNESLDPFNASSDRSPEDLAIEKYVTGFKYVPLRLNNLDNNQIKYAILQYGAVYTSIYSNMLRSNGTGYSNLSNVNQHAVSIVGWDDNYSKLNFAVTPPCDGAWIIKNSWGTSYGEKGYYYVSYYDATFPGVTDQFAAIAISAVENLSEYKYIYQYDPIGNTYESLGYNSNTAWIANQFTADSNSILQSFGLYTFGSSSYLVNITVNGVSKLVQKGDLAGAGYHTVKLNESIYLLKEDIFKIIVKLTTPDSLFPIAIESKRSDYSKKVTAQLNQSFISRDGIKWYDIANDTVLSKFYKDLNRIKLTETNVCLKAYIGYGELTSFVQVENVTTTAKSQEKISIKLVDSKSNPISNKNVSIYLVDKKVDYGSDPYLKANDFTFAPITLTTNKEGTVNFVLDLPSGNFKFLALFDGFDKYESANMTFNVTVSKIETKINNLSSINITTFAKSNYELKFNLTDGKSILKNKTMYLTIRELKQIHILTCDGKGIYKFNLDLSSGTYNFDLDFLGDEFYNKSHMTFKVNVLKRTSPTISIEKKNLNVFESLKIRLKDKNGTALPDKILKINITSNKGGKYSLSAKTNDKGIVELFNLYVGTYDISVSLENDDVYNDSRFKDAFSISRKGTKIIVSDMTTTAVDSKTDGRVGEYFIWRLVDENGIPIANTPMQIGFNGKVYTAEKDNTSTNASGYARLQINLGYKGVYTFAICFLGNDEYNASFTVSKITVNTQTGSLKVPNKAYRVNDKNKKLTATFLAASGKAVQGKNVKFIVNGKTYSATTDSKGVATVRVSLNKKGTYKFTVKYGGESTYSPISKTATLVIKA